MGISKQTALAIGDFPWAVQKLAAENKEEPRRKLTPTSKIAR